MKIRSPKSRARKTPKYKIIRAVASSTAIETGESVRVIEAKLKTGKSKFRDLKLAP